MSEWHGYEQGEARHPDRPWWRWVAYEDRKGDERDMLVRIDGREAAAMAVSVLEIAEEIDREHPLPVPPPKCGQVWVRGHVESMLVARSEHVLWWGDGDSAPVKEWPPAGAVLVAGPGAPWAPMGAP
jgi:hypothetical protein